MMASVYYQDQNLVSGLYCQGNFSNCFSIPKRKDKFLIRKHFLTKHSVLGGKITPSCK